MLGSHAYGKVVIGAVRPSTPTGVHPPKAAVGEEVAISADIFKDGHDILAARVRTCGPDGRWQELPMSHLGNDRWATVATFDGVGHHQLVVEAWVDRYSTWRHEIEAKVGAGQDVATELQEGVLLLDALLSQVPALRRPLVEEAAAALARTSCTVDVRLNAALDDAVAAALAGIPLPDDLAGQETAGIWVDRERALFSAWYEVFPRSEGGFVGVTERLKDVAEMGFDVLYFPPIHPIGTTARKGPNNTLDPGPDDVGSPWAIGGPEGGHTAIHPELGTLEDFRLLVKQARGVGIEIALDYALQCSPDHPWVREHPEWFHHRPDGSIKYAENPPKKYQDIYPIDFWPAKEADREALWQACLAIVDYWIDQGVRIFRVDNPHTKPTAFWAWLIDDVQRRHPDVLFLAEAFTRPKVMAKLAEVGFSQSYTYFTWRTTKAELVEYGTEVTAGPAADFMRPNFWPNTPDILATPLRNGPASAFRIRAFLAALLVPSWGVYSGFEWCENQPMSEANEEYLRSEKYERKARDWSPATRESTLGPFLGELNRIRRAHPACQQLRSLTFHGSTSEHVLAWSRRSGDDTMLCVVNLDPDAWHEDTLSLDLDALGMPTHEPYEARDELTGETFTWSGATPYVALTPERTGHVLHLRRRG